MTLVSGEVSASPGLGVPDVPDIALLPLVASGLAADEIAPLQATVGSAAQAHFGARLLSAEQVSERLEQGGAKGFRCDRRDPVCSAQLGAVCGVPEVLVVSLYSRPGASQLSIRLIDVGEARQLAHVAGKVQDALPLEDVAGLLRALEEPGASATSVLVRGPKGSLVVVDGEDRGALPMTAPLTDLAPGPHEIGIDGPVVFRKQVDLRRGEPLVIDSPTSRAADANPRAAGKIDEAAATAPPPPLITVAGGGITAAVGVATLAVGLAPLIIANVSAQSLADREARALQDPGVIDDEAALIREDHASVVAATAAWQSWGGITTIIGGAAIVVGLVVTGVGAAMWIE